jgi:hypothetical protein
MAAFQNLRDSFTRLSSREKLLVAVCVVAICGFLLFLAFHWMGGKLSALSKRVERQDEQLAAILAAQGKYREAEARFRETEAMLKRPAPALRGFLEGIAKSLGLSIQEYKDLPTVVLGRRKNVEERSIRVYPIKPDLKQIASFMAQIENTREHFLVVKDLRLDRAYDDQNRFQRAEITVATYALLPTGAEAKEPASSERGK